MTYIYIFLYKIIGCWENFLAGYLPQTLFPHTHTGIKCKIDLMEIGCRDKSPRGKDIFPLASSYKYMNNGGMGCQKAAMCPTYVSLKGCRGVWLAIVSLANSPVGRPQLGIRSVPAYLYGEKCCSGTGCLCFPHSLTHSLTHISDF